MTYSVTFNPQKISFEDLLHEIDTCIQKRRNKESIDEQFIHHLFEACIVFLTRRLKKKKKDDVARVKQLLDAIHLTTTTTTTTATTVDDNKDDNCLFSDATQQLKLAKTAHKNFNIDVPSLSTIADKSRRLKRREENEEEEEEEEGNEDEDNERESDINNKKWFKNSCSSDKDTTDHDKNNESTTFNQQQTLLNHEKSSGGSLAQKADKYVLYQLSVQAAKQDVYLFEKIYREHYSHQQATVFREDFCGTAWLCTEWIKRNKVENIAIGVDIDREPIEWGLKNNIASLNSASSSVFLFADNVLTFDWMKKLSDPAKTHPQLQIVIDEDNDDDSQVNSQDAIKKAHIVCAYNYSTCLLHERTQLIQYFSGVRRSMSPDNSIFLLDILGGSKLSSVQERTRKTPNSQFVYLFEQESYNPCTDIATFNIHFKFNADQSVLRKAFSFQFRKWGIREVVECLKQVGFSQVVIYWCNHTANDLEFKRLSPSEQQKLQQSEQWTALLCALY